MIEKIKYALWPHIVGLFLLAMGWYVSILNASWSKCSQGPASIFSVWTFFGLVVVMMGAYIPEVWIGFRKMSHKKNNPSTEKKLEKSESVTLPEEQG